MLSRFEVVARLRPLTLVQPRTVVPAAPYAAVETDLDGPGRVALASGDTEVAAVWDGDRVALEIRHRAHRARHVSRRHGRGHAPRALGLSLTGPLVTGWVVEEGAWVARAVVDLDAPDAGSGRVDVHDETWLGGLHAPAGSRSGGFGQLGLRDLRVVANADGTAYDPCDPRGRRVLLTATSAGPGGFRTGHTSVWSFDPAVPALEHRADLFFRRPERAGVFGDHATHLVRDEGTWLVATSTWGDFDRRRRPRVTTTLARTGADVTHGSHVLDAAPLGLPTTGLTSVGTWDPHLVRTAEGWLVGYVSATSFFRFHPVLAGGPDLDHLELLSAASARVATEGPTLVQLDDGWRLLASDGRDGRRGHRTAYPVFDLHLQQVGSLDAAYPTNLPWPTLVRHEGEWLMIGFDGARVGGPLLGYGTHGEVVVQRGGRRGSPLS